MRAGRRAVASWVALIAVGVVAAPRPAQAQLAVELVVDASGSMWGQLGGLPKTIVVREGLRPVLDRMARQDVRVGMTTFGALAASGCDNVDVPVPLGPADGTQVLEVLGSLNPRGLSSIVEAVKRAGSELGRADGKRVVVVIADGADGCAANACEAVKTWRGANGPQVFVIGLAVSETEAEQQLACVAEAGGGAYVNVSTIRGIEETLRGWVDKLVAQDREERLAADRARAEAARIRAATHLRIELRGSLAPAYCRALVVSKADLDGKPIELGAAAGDLPCAASSTLLDTVTDPGNHSLVFAYRKRSASGDVVESESITVPIAVGPAPTTTAAIEARAGMLRYRAVPTVTSAVTAPVTAPPASPAR